MAEALRSLRAGMLAAVLAAGLAPGAGGAQETALAVEPGPGAGGAPAMREMALRRAALPVPAACRRTVSASFGALCLWTEPAFGPLLVSLDEYDITEASSGIPAEVLTGFVDAPDPGSVSAVLDSVQAGWETMLQSVPGHERVTFSERPAVDGALGCRRYDWRETGTAGNRFLGRGVLCLTVAPGASAIHYVAAAVGGQRSGALGPQATAAFLARADTLLAGLVIDSAPDVRATPPEGCSFAAGNGVQQCLWESGAGVTAIFLNGRSLRTRHVFADPEADRARMLADPGAAFSRWLSMSEEAYRARSPAGWEVQALSTGMLPSGALPAGLQACRRSRVESLTPDLAVLSMIEYVCGRYHPALDVVTLIDLEIFRKRAPGTPDPGGLDPLAEAVFGSLRIRLDGAG